MKAILLGSLGILADLSALKRRAFQRAFQENGLRLPDLKPEAVRRIPRRHQYDNTPVPVSKLLGDRNAFFEVDLKASHLRRQAGLDALLDGVAAAGLAFGLVTTTPNRWMDQVLEQINLPAETFDTLVSADHVVVPKPEPDCYHLAAAMLAVAPEDCLAVEDTVFGARAAERAGMQVHMVPLLQPGGESMAHLLRNAAEMPPEAPGTA